MRIIYFIAAALIVMSCKNGSEKKSVNVNNIIIAHCGAWKQNGHPKNSIAAIRDAVKFGYAGSEFDIRMTADDTLIVYQDLRYKKLNIEKTSYAELKVHPLDNGESLPTLRDYIKAGMENNESTKLVLDIRPPKVKAHAIIMAEKIVELVKELGAKDMVIYTSFGYKLLRKINEIDPSAHTQYMDGSVAPERLKKDGIDGMAYHHSVFKKKPEWIQSAIQNNIAINAWTVNKVKDMDFFIENNFDFITTDEPTLVREKLLKFKEKKK